MTLIQKSHRVISMASSWSSESLRGPDSDEGDWTHLILVNCVPHSQMFKMLNGSPKLDRLLGPIQSLAIDHFFLLSDKLQPYSEPSILTS